MRLRDTRLPECFVVAPQFVEDERGSFARTFCAQEFVEAGLNPTIAQCNISMNKCTGTLRGLHFQAAPYLEAKLVGCSAGRIFDVAVDVRPDSVTLGRWTGVELSAKNHLALYIPEGYAHGFLTLEAECEVTYQMSVPYRPDAARGVRWDDPSLAIDWPNAGPIIVSERDRTLPFLAELLDLS